MNVQVGMQAVVLHRRRHCDALATLATLRQQAQDSTALTEAVDGVEQLSKAIMAELPVEDHITTSRCL